MRLLFDLFPILLFFVAYKVADIYVATGVAIAASVVQLAWQRFTGRPIEIMQWVSLAIIVVFGGMTLLLHDETFIKWKPTVLYGLFSLALAGGEIFFGRNLIRTLMSRQITLPDAVWQQLNRAWSGFFATMALLNIVIAYRYSTDVWVNFKLFGTLGLTLVFVVGQSLYVGRHLQDEH